LSSENTPTEALRRSKKSWEKKVTKNTTPKKRHEHSLLRWLADAKKKVGVEQEKFARVVLASAYFPPSTHLPTKNHNVSSPVGVFYIESLISDPGHGPLSLGTL
jgi:hypothetical protein